MSPFQKWAWTALFIIATPCTWLAWAFVAFFYPAGLVAGTQSLWDATKTAGATLRRLHDVSR